MSDNEKKNTTVNDAVTSSASTERLRAASLRLSSHKSGSAATHVSEDEREERAREAKARMRENIERAGREAAERREFTDSKNEYRQGVLIRENRRTEAAKRERERLEAEERLERARRIEEERELYLQREREENARASEGVFSLYEKLSAREGVSEATDEPDSRELTAEADASRADESADLTETRSEAEDGKAASPKEAPEISAEDTGAEMATESESRSLDEAVADASCPEPMREEALEKSDAAKAISGIDAAEETLVALSDEAPDCSDPIEAKSPEELSDEAPDCSDPIEAKSTEELYDEAPDCSDPIEAKSAEELYDEAPDCSDSASAEGEALASETGSDGRITITVGGSDVPADRLADADGDEKTTIRIGENATEPRVRSGVSIDGDTLRIEPPAHPPFYPHMPPRVDFSGELRAAEERHLARRRAAVSVAAGIYSEELRLLAEEEARYSAEIAEIKARRSEYSEWLSELDGRELIYGEHSEGASYNRGTREEASSDLSAREYEEHNESTLADIRASEDNILREYERYVAEMERGGKGARAETPVGEALPYTRETERFTPREAEPPRYEEADYDSLSEGYRAHGEPYASELGGYVPMGYGTDSDRGAVREYEAEMARRRSAELRDAERGARSRDELSALELEHIEDAEKGSHIYRGVGLDLYAKSRLSSRIDRFFKESAILLKREKRLARAQAKASVEENVQIIVEKIAIAKELCEMAADVLGACVYVGSRARTGKHKRILISYVEKYNSLCDEYERQTGRAVDRVDLSMVDDVMAGKLYQPIQNVYYHGMEDDPTHAGLTPALDREHRLETEESLVADEYARYVEDGAYPEQTVSEKRAAAKRRSERMGAIRRAAERDLLLISLRAEHRITSLQARKDVLSYSFDIDKRDRQREIRKIEKQIGKIRYAERKSHELERRDNSRYYYLAALPLAEENIKSGARRERLEALRLRLDVLLAERESINDRLIALYGGSDGRFKKARVARKAGKIRKRAARAMYKRQRELARKIDKIKAPVDMKERVIELLNKRIADASEYESLRYTLRSLHPGGRAREELVRSIKRAKKRLRLHEREIKYMIKKLKKHEEKYRSEREWAGFLIAVALIVGLGIAAWVLFGDSIKGYFSELAAYFGF